MAVKDETACYLTDALIAKDPRRHYRTRINPIHWQLRSLIGVSQSNTVYYPAGLGNLHIQEFDTVTQRSETIAFLSFSPRCLVARNGWICCGGEEGEFVAIQLNTGASRSTQSPGAVGSGDGRNDLSTRGADSDGDGDPGMDDEEYDDFDLRMSESSPALVTVPPRLVAKSQKFGKERVNCITVWTPPTFIPLCPGGYECPVAVLANNDKHVTLVNLDNAEELDELDYPDCVNRAVLSPDGRLLAAVSDDPYLYIHERIEKPEPVGSRHRLSRPELRGNIRKQFEWRLLARHHLRGQSKDDQTVHRGSFAACFSNTGKYLAIGTQYGVISIFDASTLDEQGESLIACFTSSNPNVDSGAVREMSFCPGPFDLLAWSEDHGAVGVADVRNGFVSRQVLQLCDDSAYEHVAINQIIHINDEFVEERRRRRQHQSAGADESVRNVLTGTRLATGDYNISSDEQALRIRDALDRYHMPLTTDETQFLDALQERRRRREREQREQQNQQQSSRNQRERDRERIQDYLGRRSAWLLRSRPSLGSGPATDNIGGGSNSSNTNNNNNGNVGGDSSSSSAARSRERNDNMSMAVNDILGSLRSLRNARDAAELERRWLASPPGLLQAARQSGAIPTIENEDSGSDDDGFSSRTLTEGSRRRQPWGSMDPSPVAYGGSGNVSGAGEGGSSSRTMDLLHAYTSGEQAPSRSSFASNTRRERTALPDTLLGQNTLLDWDNGVGATTARRAREPGPSEQKDGHTAGLAWSDDGTILYIGTEGGIFEFRVNIKARMFYPSVTMR